MAERIRPSSTSAFPGLVIENVVLTGVRLGSGADATVFEVDWNGTRCAAKRLHDILLEDQSAGGVAKLLRNFEVECLTWSKLCHPGVVQFLGVHMDRRSRLPVLVMEKMDTSLRTYLEHHSKEEFPLHQKAFVLRQVTQALAYLHSQNPPLVHHDLSSNNVLLNMVSFVTKVSDFGMSRAINPFALTRKSSIKGTLPFMPPEALHNGPRYNEKLDVFSFGNVVLHTLTHEWPDPGPPTRYEGEVFVAVTELQRREQCVELLTAQEKQLFVPIVRQCLENRPDKRPSSVMLVQDLRHIESTLPRGSHVSAPIEHLQQQLSAKEEECRQQVKMNEEKDEVIKQKDGVIKEKDKALKEKDGVIGEKDKASSLKDNYLRGIRRQLAAKEAECRYSEKVVRQKSATIREQQAEILQLRDQMAAQQAEIQRLRDQPAVSQKVCTYAFLPSLVVPVESPTVTTGHRLNSSIRWLLSVRISMCVCVCVCVCVCQCQGAMCSDLWCHVEQLTVAKQLFLAC